MADHPPASGRRARWRGQPLVFLLTVICIWSAARIVHHWTEAERRVEIARPDGARIERLRPARAVSLLPGPQRIVASLARPSTTALHREPVPPARLPLDVALAHQQLWIESLAGAPGRSASGLPVSAPLLDGPLMPPAATPPPSPLPSGIHLISPQISRWSVYGWSLLRRGGSAPVLAPAAQYGGSQAGLLVRYAVSGDAGHRAALYARAAGALSTSDDRMLALGVSVRPVPRWPVDLALERRLALGTGQRDRTALMAVAAAETTHGRTGIRLEAYGQAGMVGFSDPIGFFDLQLLATRPVLRRDRAALALGAGLWAGGQQNPDGKGEKPWGHRIDLGPRAALTLPVEQGSLALALDWRQRIGGDARPASGAALTLSAGF